MAEEEYLGDLEEIINASMGVNGGGNGGAAGGAGGGGGHHILSQSTSLPVMPSHLPLHLLNQSQNQAPPPKPSVKSGPHLRIVEEPTNNIIRFRYKCEGRTAGSIPGMNSNSENGKTFPTIEVCNYDGPVVIVVSCVTSDEPYRQHPHWLVSKEEADACKSGVYSKRLPPEERRLVLQKVGIQCAKKLEMRDSLLERERKNVDPFGAKFDHKDQIDKINRYELRLCYQAFITVGHTRVALDPIVSSPIYGKSNELTINRLCSCSAPVTGGNEIIMLCERVGKDDIEVRFYETDSDGRETWHANAEFLPTDVFKQMAIAFKTPRYRNPEITQSVHVELKLVRPSDGATSAPLKFEYYPNPGTVTFARLQRKLKRRQELDVFQQILSLDSESATKYSCPPLDLEEENNTVSSDDQQSSGTLNEFEIMVKKLQMQQRGESHEMDGGTATEYTDNDNEPDMEIELEVPQLLPQLADDCTQTSTPMEEILQHPQLQSRPLTNVDKITEWMKSSEFERTDSLTVENGDTQSLSNSTAQTAFTNVSSLTANTTITNQLEEEAHPANGSRRDTLENPAVKELPEADKEPEMVTASAQASVDLDENFDETATYTSLQIAFNNPINIAAPKESRPGGGGIQIYPPTNPFGSLDDAELVVLTNPPAPRIKVNAAQTPATPPDSPPLPLPPRTPSPDPEHRLPPLPPKPQRNSQDLSIVSDSISISRSRNGSLSSARTTPSPIIIMRTPDQSPTKRQPTPSESPKKRQGFFSRFFSRRKSRAEDDESLTPGASPSKQVSGRSKANTPTGSREPSVAHFSLGDPNRSSTKSMQPLGKSEGRNGKPVGRSSSSVSGKRPAHLDADVIHIPLKGGDSENSLLRPESYSNASTLSYGRPLDRKTLSTLQLADIPISDGNMELVAIADRQSIRNLCEGAYGVVLDPSVDLSEAEHFALYTSKSPEPPFGETLTQHNRSETRKAVESLKRGLMSTDFYPTKHVKTSSPFTAAQPPQMATTTAPQTQTQLSPGMAMMYPGGGSPHFMHEIKVEQAFMDVDSRSSHCPSVDYNFPSPRSNSTVDSIPPMPLGQNNNHLYLPDASNFPTNPGNSPSRFNGGTMTPINNNNNGNMMMNNNNNNNGFVSLKLNAINSPTQDMKQVFQQPQQYLPPQQPEQHQYLPQFQPEQIQYPQQQQQQHHHQQQQPQHQTDGQQQSFSDLILSSTLMDLGTIDTNELIQGIDETLSTLGLTGGAIGGAAQMNNNFANY